jgi:hypothetical protein
MVPLHAASRPLTKQRLRVTWPLGTDSSFSAWTLPGPRYFHRCALGEQLPKNWLWRTAPLIVMQQARVTVHIKEADEQHEQRANNLVTCYGLDGSILVWVLCLVPRPDPLWTSSSCSQTLSRREDSCDVGVRTYITTAVTTAGRASRSSGFHPCAVLRISRIQTSVRRPLHYWGICHFPQGKFRDRAMNWATVASFLIP